MSDNETTPDMMRELLENAGYQLMWLPVDNNLHVRATQYGKLIISTPDGWLRDSPSCYEDSFEAIGYKHALITKAYAHYQQAQELKSVRAKVAGLKAQLAEWQCTDESLPYAVAFSRHLRPDSRHYVYDTATRAAVEYYRDEYHARAEAKRRNDLAKVKADD